MATSKDEMWSKFEKVSEEVNELENDCRINQKEYAYKEQCVSQLILEKELLEKQLKISQEREYSLQRALTHTEDERDVTKREYEENVKSNEELEHSLQKCKVQQEQCNEQAKIIHQRYMIEVEKIDLDKQRAELEKEKHEFDLKKKQEELNCLKAENSKIMSNLDELKREIKQNQDNQMKEVTAQREQALLVAEHWQHQFEAVDKEKQKLKQQLDTLHRQSFPESPSYDSGYDFSPPNSPRKRGRFFIYSDIQECRRCKVKYNQEENNENACNFHPVPEASQKMWKSFQPQDIVEDTSYAHFKYWLCCNKFQARRPEGCCKGYHVSS